MSLAVSSPSPSTVSFPATDGPGPTAPPSSFQQVRPAYLPFRRISLPSPPPNMVHRHSIGSLASFESFPEEESRPPAVPAVLKNVAKKSRPRPTSIEPARRSQARLKPIDESREAKRRKIIMEFYETERSYVDGLELMYSHFLTPIVATLETAHPLLSASELTAVFANFIDIWNLHRRFYDALSELLLPPDSTSAFQPPPLAPLLLAHFPYLSLYNPFVTSFPTALTSLNSFLSSKPAFAAFVREREVDPRCGKLKLRDWLLTIVQRCPRYLLLLKDLITCTDPADPEHSALTAAHTLVSKITNSLNTSLHTHAQTLGLLALQRATPNLPFQLISPGRTLLKRGPLLQLEGASAPKEREFLLFSDCLLWLVNAERGADDATWGTDVDSNGNLAVPMRPPMMRKRSKSDASLPSLREGQSDEPELSAAAARRSRSNLSALVIPKTKKKKTRVASSGTEDRWIYRGKAELVDIEVIVPHPRDPGDERRIEILSPEASFAIYADNAIERDEWAAALRNAKAALLMALHAMHANSTLTSSSSTAHLRRTLQAIPYAPEEEAAGKHPRRNRVEHFVPAIWVPDAKTEACMRCGRTFGWRRRRHHCRLCGRCVCSGCSGKTFYVSDPSNSVKSKPARACNACYETVFPLVDPEPDEDPRATGSQIVPPSNTVSTLSGFPTWQSLSTPALALQGGAASKQASALMAIDISPTGDPPDDDDDELLPPDIDWREDAGTPPASPGHPRIRVRQPLQRPKSYIQILEDFHEEGRLNASATSPAIARTASALTSASSVGETSTTEEETSASPARSPRKEDTVRRHKRFSMPAMALQTTPVTTRPSQTGEGKSKRFSLVLGKGGAGGKRANEEGRRSKDLGSGAAATKLNELLGRKKSDG